MAEITKFAPVNGGTLISDFKTHITIFRTKRIVAIAYGFVFIFFAFTIFLAISPSSNTSSPWFTDIFAVSNTTSPSSSSNSSDESYRSHFSSIYYYFFPNSSSTSSQAHNFLPTDYSGSQSSNFSQPNSNKEPTVIETQTKSEEITHKVEVLKQNQTQSDEFHSKDEVMKTNKSVIAVSNSLETSNKSVNSSANSASDVKNIIANGEKGIAENGVVENLTTSLMKQNNSIDNTKEKQGFDDLIKSLLNCAFFDGNWVRDDSYPLYKPGSCSLIDEQFNCFLNGRLDNGYYKRKWKPKSCTLPRLNGSHMLELLRGKRLVFVGDSLNWNMWESLICILRNSVKDKKKVYEVSGRQHFRTEASYSFAFQDYKCTVELFCDTFIGSRMGSRRQ